MAKVHKNNERIPIKKNFQIIGSRFCTKFLIFFQITVQFEKKMIKILLGGHVLYTINSKFV